MFFLFNLHFEVVPDCLCGKVSLMTEGLLSSATEDLTFVPFGFQKLNDESIMRSLLEIKTPFRSIARSYILTTPESSNIGILEVDASLAALLPVPAGPL